MNCIPILAKVKAAGHATTAESSSTSPASASHASHTSLLLHEHLEEHLWVDSAHSTHTTTVGMHTTGLSMGIVQVLFFDAIVITLLLDRVAKNLIS